MEKLDILFVDDDRHILDLVKSYLLRQGLEVTIHSDGLKALETLKRKNFDIVFSDLMMPELRGSL